MEIIKNCEHMFHTDTSLNGKFRVFIVPLKVIKHFSRFYETF